MPPAPFSVSSPSKPVRMLAAELPSPFSTFATAVPVAVRASAPVSSTFSMLVKSESRTLSLLVRIVSLPPPATSTAVSPTPST